MAPRLTFGNIKNPTALHAMMVDVVDALKGIAAKLDADAGITDTNYASLWTDILSDEGDAKTNDPAIK